MDIYLKPASSPELDDSERLRFPLVPDRINIETAANVLSLSVIKLGEIKIPRGSKITGYSWSGLFPGEGMADASFVFDWQAPTDIIKRLKEWQEAGTTLTLMVTELCINEDVFIESLHYEYFGVGDCSYDLSLSVRKPLTVMVTPKSILPTDSAKTTDATMQSGTVKKKCNYLNKPSSKGKKLGTLKKGATIDIVSKKGKYYKFKTTKTKSGYAWVRKTYVRVLYSAASSVSVSQMSNYGSETNGSGGSTYTVKSGDTLYAIAKTKLGKGTLLDAIYALNQTAMDAMNKGESVSKYTVHEGQILKLPTT